MTKEDSERLNNLQYELDFSGKGYTCPSLADCSECPHYKTKICKVFIDRKKLKKLKQQEFNFD